MAISVWEHFIYLFIFYHGETMKIQKRLLKSNSITKTLFWGGLLTKLQANREL